MGLVVTRLTLRNFRSYELFEIEPDRHLTVLVGENAVGKTNAIEAIELVTAGNSFRRPQWSELVRWGSAECQVSLQAGGDGRAFSTDLTVSSDGRRSYRVNGKAKRRIAEVAGIIPCVVFTPDDLRMVKDSADKRRAAIDDVGDQLSPAYLAARMEYERVLRQRNALLKDPGSDEGVLDALTERLIAHGASFCGHRRRLFDRIVVKLSDVYETLSPGETLSAEYIPSWDRGGELSHGDPVELMAHALGQRASEERARGLTLVGPHRDEVAFLIGGRDARSFGSQGQTRTIALAWKLAEVSVISEIAGQPPVLLLDDVMSELDERRRHALASFVGGAAQTFVTTTNLGYFEGDMIRRAKVIHIP